MIHIVKCTRVECDRCGRSAPAFESEIGSEAHFPSPSAAVEQLAGWQLNPGTGAAQCPDCVANAACERDGHDLEAWHACSCQGRLRHHRAAATVDAILTSSCAMQYRRCVRCPDYTEERPHHAAPQDA